MFDLVIYICLRKYWNFQSEAKVEQIIAIVTARSVSCFCCYCYYFYPLFLSHAKAIISITHWENGLVHVTNKNTSIYAILCQFTAILCQKYLFWTIKETFFEILSYIEKAAILVSKGLTSQYSVIPYILKWTCIKKW